MRDILAGAVLKLNRIEFGGSVFLGNFSLINIIFDGLGVFFIVMGLIKVAKRKQAA